MKADKLRDLDDRELNNQIKEIRDQTFRLRFQLSMGQTDGLKKLRELRKDKARILSILRDREIKAAAGQRS